MANQFLGDEVEETRRKTELKSILLVVIYGWLGGGVVGGLLGGYNWAVVGMMAGPCALALFAVLGVRAERRMAERERRKSVQREASPTTTSFRAKRLRRSRRHER